jgi:hypothetical protein
MLSQDDNEDDVTRTVRDGSHVPWETKSFQCAVPPFFVLADILVPGNVPHFRGGSRRLGMRGQEVGPV